MYGSNIGTVDAIKTAAGTAAIPVASTATVYTPSFPLYGADAFGVSLLAASDNDVDVKVELEEGMERPATEEAASASWVEPDGLADIALLSDEVLHIVQVTPVPAKYGRFKLTGQGTNDATTTVTINLFRQEQV